MKVTINNNSVFDIEVDDGIVSFDSEAVKLDVRPISNRRASIIYKNKSYNVEMVEEDKALKTCSIKVNGTIYEAQIKDRYDQLLKQLGLDVSQMSKVLEVKAPMPGLVLKVLVEQGQQVTKGENLLVLEAMKMENMIKSPSSGIIKQVLVSTGDKVEKNGILIQFT